MPTIPSSPKKTSCEIPHHAQAPVGWFSRSRFPPESIAIRPEAIASAASAYAPVSQTALESRKAPTGSRHHPVGSSPSGKSTIERASRTIAGAHEGCRRIETGPSGNRP